MKKLALTCMLISITIPALADQVADCSPALDAVAEKLTSRAQQCFNRRDHACADAYASAALEVKQDHHQASELKKKIEAEIKNSKKSIQFN